LDQTIKVVNAVIGALQVKLRVGIATASKYNAKNKKNLEAGGDSK
jgi:hypothetical protein